MCQQFLWLSWNLGIWSCLRCVFLNYHYVVLILYDPPIVLHTTRFISLLLQFLRRFWGCLGNGYRNCGTSKCWKNLCRIVKRKNWHVRAWDLRSGGRKTDWNDGEERMTSESHRWWMLEDDWNVQSYSSLQTSRICLGNGCCNCSTSDVVNLYRILNWQN